MKNSIKVLSLIAVAAMTFIGCSKSDEVNITETFSHRVTIKASQPATKTVIVEGTNSASFKWSSDDANRFVIKENGTEGTDVSISSNDGYVTMALSALFSTETASSYTYTAFLAKNKTNGGAPKIPATQTCSTTSYDPNADILIAKPLTFDNPQDELSMQFKRPAVINKMTLKGLTVGETISTVKIEADKDIVGYYHDPDWTGQGQVITVTVNQTVPASGQIVVYFVSMPVSETILSVEATSANYIFSKTFTKTITFIENQITVFGVNNLTRTGKANYSGTYVLINADGTKMAKAWANGNNVPAVDITSENGFYYFNPDEATLSEAQIILARDADHSNMYTMKQNGYYLYAAGSATDNYLKGQTEPGDNAYWEISNNDNDWSVASSNSKILRYNSGSKWFSCYASGQNAIAFISVDKLKPTPVVTASDFSIGAAAVTSATNTGATFNSNTSTVTASAHSDQSCTSSIDWLSVSVSGSGADAIVKYTASANTSTSARTGYIKITASNSDGRNVSKIIAVSQSFPNANTYSLYTGDLVEGDYVIVYDGYAMNNTVSSNRLGGTSVSISNNKITNPSASIIWHIAPSGDYWTIFNEEISKYACGTGSKNVINVYSDANPTSYEGQGYWTVTHTGNTYDFVNVRNTTKNVNATLRKNGTYGFACYASGTGGALSLYKLDEGGSGGGSSTDYSTTYTTDNNVTVAVSSGSNTSKVQINNVDYNAFKANKSATFTITVPSGTSKIHLFIAAWSGESQTVSVTGGEINNDGISADSGISGSGATYTLAGTISSYYRTITVESNTTEITIGTASGKRAVVWGVNAE